VAKIPGFQHLRQALAKSSEAVAFLVDSGKVLQIYLALPAVERICPDFA